jgi:PKD repeat protein
VPSGGSAAELAIVPDQAPIASFTATPVPTGSPTGFDASGSTAVSSPITKYAWSFGDGTVATTTGPTTTHTYAAAGSYIVTLTLTDQAGTSTKIVFTGQTVNRDGAPDATAQRTVDVPAALQSIAVTPANASVVQGGTRQYTATGTYSDGSTQDLTTTATWSSSNPNVTISNAAGSQGLATASTTTGSTTTTITATDAGVSGFTGLTVTCRLHQNGLGQTYSDCAPLGTPGNSSTYNQTMAQEAATAWNASGTIQMEQCGSGANVAQVVVDQVSPAGPTAVWTYSATGTQTATVGHVFASSSSTASCPLSADPAWN